jgi:hypothetical protein
MRFSLLYYKTVTIDKNMTYIWDTFERLCIRNGGSLCRVKTGDF